MLDICCFILTEMKPNDPIVIEFDTIVLNCTLTSLYSGSCSARDLYIRHNGVDFKYPHIQAITDKTAQFGLPNATIENNGLFWCQLPPTCNVGAMNLQNVQYVHVQSRCSFSP